MENFKLFCKACLLREKWCSKENEEIIRTRVLGSPPGKIVQGAKYHFHTVTCPSIKRFKGSYKKIDFNFHRNTALKVSTSHYRRTFNDPFNELMKLLLKTLSSLPPFLLLLENCLRVSSVSSISWLRERLTYHLCQLNHLP